jgi:hypothetical protein
MDPSRPLSLPQVVFVEQQSIRCLSCDRGWSMPSSSSIHEQQALESCPCPFCGAYTLCCAEEDRQEQQRPALPR